MTTKVVTVTPDTPIKDIAEILETRHIKRVPVVDGGKVVGIVSRANLIPALATIASPGTERIQADEASIHDAILAEIQKVVWPLPLMNTVTVNNGIVHLWGYVGSDNERRAVRIIAERVPGVKAMQESSQRRLVTALKARARLEQPVAGAIGNPVRWQAPRWWCWTRHTLSEASDDRILYYARS